MRCSRRRSAWSPTATPRVEDVDIGIRDGLALRWSFMGPFETIDLNAPGGVRDYVERYQAIYEQSVPADAAAGRLGRPVLATVEAGAPQAPARGRSRRAAGAGATAG